MSPWQDLAAGARPRAPSLLPPNHIAGAERGPSEDLISSMAARLDWSPSLRLVFFATASPCLVSAVQISRSTYQWPGKPGIQLHYAQAGSPQNRLGGRTPIVLLPGFGVGTFHWYNQLRHLGAHAPTYAVDWLGQGESWPEDEAAEHGLRYDAMLWCDQLELFINEVLNGQRVILCGNSLGGFIAVQLALKRPDLVRGLALLNATPLWSFAPPISSEDDGRVWRPFGWDATLPAPRGPYAIGSRWFDALRSPVMIRNMLEGVYADSRVAADLHPDYDAPTDDLASEIARCASARGGHAAFTSILFSPRTPVSFEDALVRVCAHDDAPHVALLYGASDPWVRPLWAVRAYRRAVAGAAAPSVLHYRLDPSGHCPHHETPRVVNQLLEQWTAAVDGDECVETIMPGAVESMESLGRKVSAERVDGQPRGILEMFAAALDRNLPRPAPSRGRDLLGSTDPPRGAAAQESA